MHGTAAPLSVIAASILLAAPVGAATIVNDGFTDGDRTSLTPAGATTPKTSIPFFVNNTVSTTLSVASSDASFGGNYLVLDTADAGNSGGNDKVALGAFFNNPITLAVNDTVTVSFRFKNNYNFTTANAIGFGLYSSAGTNATGDTVLNQTDDDGYGFTLGGLPDGANDDGGIREYVDSINVVNGGTEILGTDVDQPGTNNTNTTMQTGSFTVARTGVSTVLLTMTVTNATANSPYVFSVTDSTSPFVSFNQFIFGTTGQSSAGVAEVLIDDVMIETGVVPEPTAIALLALASGGLLGRVRRA